MTIVLCVLLYGVSLLRTDVRCWSVIGRKYVSAAMTSVYF